MVVAFAEEIDIDERFSQGLRDRKNNMPRSRLTDGRGPYDRGYRQEEIYQDGQQPQTSVGGKGYRRQI